MSRSTLGLCVALSLLAALVGAVMWFKWNSDGPGTHGGGEDLDRKIEAPMAAPMQPPESALSQRRHERASVAGTVRDLDGHAIAGAQVCATATSDLLSSSETRWPRCVHSDQDGHYLLGDLYGVRHRVSAGAANYLPADHLHLQGDGQRRAIDLRPGSAAQNIDVVLLPGGVEIRGVVRDLRGQPIGDAWVASGTAQPGHPAYFTTTDGDGHYALWVAPGTVTVTARAAGHVPGSASGPSEGHAFILHLAPASLLRGRVVRSDNRDPVDDAWVRANAGGDAVKTDPAGNFLFDDLPPGVYQPRVETEDGLGTLTTPVTLGLAEQSTRLQIVVKPAFSVEGRIVFKSGEVCDDGSLTLRDGAHGTEARDPGEPGGMVHLRGVLPGSYDVTVTCTGAIAASRYPRVLVRDRDVVDQVWYVEPGRGIAGVLLDAAGQPVRRATLAVEPEPAPAPATPPRLAISDDAGRFVFKGLDPGGYRILPIAHPRHTMPGAPTSVKITDADITGLQLTLPATGELHGHVLDPRHRPIVGAVLTLRSARGQVRVITDDDGGFHFASVAVGPASAAVELGGVRLPLQSSTPIEILGDRPVTRELIAVAATRSITGVLHDHEGQPVAGALVEARPEGVGLDTATTGLWRAAGDPPQLTDLAGRFTLTALITAPYAIVARPFGGGEVRRHHVQPGAALTLVLPAKQR